MELNVWTQSLVAAMTALWTKIANFIPNLFGALVVVLLGFVVAKLLDALLSKLLAKLGLDRLMGGTGLTKILARVGIQVPISTLIGKIVYWFVLLVFLVSAAQSLGLDRVSSALDLLTVYLPKVFGALLVLLAGVLLAQVLNGLVRGAAESVGFDYASGLGRVTQGLVIIISISVAISQLEVKTDLLNHVIVIVLITVGLAIALAMGLGSREIAGQILAGIYVRELYQVGQEVRVGEVEGQIEEIGTVKTTLLTDEGESAPHAAQREVKEEVGIDISGESLSLMDCQHCVEFELFAHLCHRYAPGVTRNLEHWFCLALPSEREIPLTEHLAYQWLDVEQAAQLTKSWSKT